MIIRVAAVVLIIYSNAMLFYGSAEATHDLLHFLSEHYSTSVHNHSHNHHHTFHDHEHFHEYVINVNIVHEGANTEDSLVLVTFFLYVQKCASFYFGDTDFTTLNDSDIVYLNHKINPPTPPPQFLFPLS